MGPVYPTRSDWLSLGAGRLAVHSPSAPETCGSAQSYPDHRREENRDAGSLKPCEEQLREGWEKGRVLATGCSKRRDRRCKGTQPYCQWEPNRPGPSSLRGRCHLHQLQRSGDHRNPLMLSPLLEGLTS